jgi:hypothetical protein
MPTQKRSKPTDIPPAFVCVNCDHPIEITKQVRLFCSELCADEAKFVRYFRRCKQDGRIKEPDVLEAIQIRFAHIMGGGYNARARHIPPSVRAAVLKRDGGVCRSCGQPGTDIDHISNDSDDMENLQLLCKSCHNKKTQQQIIEITPEDERYLAHTLKANALRSRCESALPLRLCDDQELWPKQQNGIRSEWRKTMASS